MAIYRPARARWPLAVAVGVVALIVGVLVGLALTGDDDATGAEEIQSALFGAAGSVEVAAIEYEEAVVGGGDVTSTSEYKGARDALQSGRARYAEVRAPLQTLAPERVEELDAAFDAAEELMESEAEASEVVAALEDLETLLKEGTS